MPATGLFKAAAARRGARTTEPHPPPPPPPPFPRGRAEGGRRGPGPGGQPAPQRHRAAPRTRLGVTAEANSPLNLPALHPHPPSSSSFLPPSSGLPLTGSPPRPPPPPANGTPSPVPQCTGRAGLPQRRLNRNAAAAAAGHGGVKPTPPRPPPPSRLPGSARLASCARTALSAPSPLAAARAASQPHSLPRAAPRVPARGEGARPVAARLVAHRPSPLPFLGGRGRGERPSGLGGACRSSRPALSQRAGTSAPSAGCSEPPAA